MQEILAIILPVFIIVAVGFVAVKWGFFSKGDVGALSRFVIDFALPALLFKSLSQRSFGDILNGGYLLAYAAGSLFAFGIGFGLAYFRQGRRMEVSALHGMGMAFSNSAFFGYPVVLQFVGSVAGVGLAMTMMVENLLILPLILTLAEIGSHQGGHAGGRVLRTILGNVFRRLRKNPLIIAIALGTAFAALGWRLPTPVSRGVDLLAAASAGVALFVIGGALVGPGVRGMVREIVQIAAGKLILHPLCVLVALTLLPGIDASLAAAAFVFASMPMLSVYPVIGQKYGHERLCAASLLATTMVSFVTISVVLWLVESGLVRF